MPTRAVRLLRDNLPSSRPVNVTELNEETAMNDAYTKCKVVFSNASYFITMTASPFSVTKDNANSIKLVLEDIDKISDIADTDGDGDAVHEEYVVRDMYHHVFDITEKTLAAESAEKRLYDIGSCDAQPVVFNGKVQGPKVVFNGEVLQEGVD